MIQPDATVRRYLFTAKSLSTCFGCPLHPSSGEHKTVTAASGTGHSICATIFLRDLIMPRWRKVVAQILWLVPEAAVTVLCSPDYGCDGHPKHVESDFAVNKYPHTVASRWILLIWSYDVRNHEYKKQWRSDTVSHPTRTNIRNDTLLLLITFICYFGADQQTSLWK